MSSEPLCDFVFGDERRQRSNERQQLCSGHKENNYNTHMHTKRSPSGLRNHITFGPCLPIGHENKRTHDCVFPPVLASFPRTYWQEHRNAYAHFFGRSYHSNESSDLSPVANRIP